MRAQFSMVNRKLGVTIVFLRLKGNEREMGMPDDQRRPSTRSGCSEETLAFPGQSPVINSLADAMRYPH